MKKLPLLLGLFCVCNLSFADVMIDVRNDTSEDCSLAIHARTDKTKWLTQGWYVFASGEEAPIILHDVNDVHNVYIYNDCTKVTANDKVEPKKVWVKINYKFSDNEPKDHVNGYEEVVFERLQSNKYQITN